MLTIQTVPQLFKIISKLDAKPIIERLKDLDVWDENAKDENGEPIKTLDREKVGILAFEILAEVTPQLDKIGADVPELIALDKNISVEEANKLDFAQVLNELINDDGVVNFFKVAFKKKAEQG